MESAQKQLTPEAQELRREYFREYRRRNPEKMREYQRRCWEKKAALLSAEKEDERTMDE